MNDKEQKITLRVGAYSVTAYQSETCHVGELLVVRVDFQGQDVTQRVVNAAAGCQKYRLCRHSDVGYWMDIGDYAALLTALCMPKRTGYLDDLKMDLLCEQNQVAA